MIKTIKISDTHSGKNLKNVRLTVACDDWGGSLTYLLQNYMNKSGG